MFRHIRSTWCVSILVLVTVATATWLNPAFAADKLGNSADFVPADATFYACSMRGKEQLDKILASKAWSKVQNLPAVQMAWQQVQVQLNQPDSPLQLLQLPENQELLELGGDMISHESFFYGDKTWLGFLQLASELNAYRYRSMFSQITDEMGEQGLGARSNSQERQRKQFRAMLESLSENVDLIKTPNFVAGFKLSDIAPARRQLKRLEVMAGLLLAQNPKLKERLKRAKIDGNDFVELSLDGELVPWEKLPLARLEDEPGEFDKLKEALKKLTIVISLGVRDQYLIVSIGGSNTGVANLGKGKPLTELPEFARVQKYSKERLTNIGYASKDLMAQSGMTKKDVDEMATAVSEDVVPNVPVPDEMKARITKDVKQLAADLKVHIPDPGALLSFTFLTGKGYEQYSYNWAQNLVLDDSKPLTLAQHVGGTPMAAIVGRAKTSTQAYATGVKWIKVFFGYFEEIAVPQFPPQKRDEYTAVREAFLPLIKRIETTTRTMLIPSLADGQQALVLDTKAKSNQWHNKMPAAQAPLPMLEIALVLGVSDANLLKKACTEYKSIADDVLAKVRELNPGKIPADFKLPVPVAEPTSNKSGTVYIYRLPAEAGLDAQLAPNAGLSSKVAVLSFVPSQTARLLTPTPLAAPEGVLADAQKRNLAILTSFNWPSLVTAIEPWVEYGVRAAAGPGALEAAGADSLLLDEAAKAQLVLVAKNSAQTKFILEHVRVVADVLKIVRGIGSITYSEDGAMVTHLECRMKDVD